MASLSVMGRPTQIRGGLEVEVRAVERLKVTVMYEAINQIAYPDSGSYAERFDAHRSRFCEIAFAKARKGHVEWDGKVVVTASDMIDPGLVSAVRPPRNSDGSS